MRLSFAAFVLSAPVGAFRVHNAALKATQSQSTGEGCECATSRIVNGLDAGREGCGVHFGQQFGYVCYVKGGSSCTAAKESRSRPGLYWRSCAADHRIELHTGYLLKAMEGIDIQDIQTNIRIAQAKGVDQKHLDAAAQRVEVIRQMEAARDELMQAVKGLDYDRLKAALEAAEELELDAFLSEETLEQAVERFGFLGRRHEATQALLKGIQGDNLDELAAQLATATGVNADPEVLSQGRQRIQQLTAMRDSVVALEAAIVGRDTSAIAEALAQCQSLGALNSDLESRAEARTWAIEEMEEAAAELRGLLESDDGNAVKVALERARKADVDPGLIAQGVETLERTSQHMQEVHDRLRYLTYESRPQDKEEMENLIAEAERLQAANPDEIGQARYRCATLR